MKKILLVLMCCFLVACQSGKSDINPVIIFKDEDKKVEAIEYLERDTLDSIVRTLNQRLLVVDIEKHHEMISQELLIEFNMDKSIESQEEMIQRVILDYLQVWKREELQVLLDEENKTIDEVDKEEIIKRSSIKSAYTLIKAYEIIYLKKQTK